MKICQTCGVEKDLSKFSKSSSNKDFHQHKCKDCFASWYLTNRNKRLLKDKQNYLVNKDAICKRKRDNYYLDPLKSNLKEQKRRAQKLSNGIYKITTKEFKKLKNQNCFYCGSYNQIEIDHVLPISRGGTHSVGNLVSACLKCNRSKKDKTIMEWRNQWNNLSAGS